MKNGLRKFLLLLKNLLNSIEFHIAQGIFIFGIISFIIAFFAFDNKADKIETDLINSDLHVETSIQDKADKNQISKGLLSQYQYLKLLKKQHLETARSYEVLYFTCTYAFLFFSIITGIITFLMTRQGWENANNKLKAAFLTCVFLTTLTGAIPKVFEHEKDASNNIAKYFEYNKLQMEIFYVMKSTVDLSDSLKNAKRNDTFKKVIDGINANNNLFINLSPNQSPTTIDVFKELEKQKNVIPTP